MGNDPNLPVAALTSKVRLTRGGTSRLVLLLFFTAVASYLSRVNISVIGALMMRDLGFSQISMGRLFSAFVFGYALFQIPAGAGADRWGARRVLGWAALSWVVVTLLMAALGTRVLGQTTASAFIVLLILRFALGVGEAPTFPAAAQVISRWIPPTRQGMASGVVLAALGAGSAIAPALLSPVMVRWGWRVALIVSAIPAMAVALTWMSFRGPGGGLPDPAPQFVPSEGRSADLPKDSFWSRGGRTKAGLAEQKSVLWSPSFIFLTLSYTLEGYVGNIFVFWSYLYFVQVRHFNLLSAGRLATIPWLLCIISIPLGGIVSDYLVAGPFGTLWGRRTVPMFGLASAGILLALGARTGSGIAAVVYFALATALELSVEGVFWATMVELAGPNSGTAGGVMNCGSNIGGLISPALTPLMAAYMGWENALYVGSALAVLAAALWLGVSPHISKDLRPSEVPVT